MTASTTRRFGAFIDPDRVYVLEYRRNGPGIEILEHMSVARNLSDVVDASEALVDLLQLSVSGDEGVSLAAAIRGFGISYHLLTLPPAGAEVLAPVIEREMRRLFPDVEDPVVGFAVGGHIDRRTGKPTAAPAKPGLPERRSPGAAGEILPLEILAAAAPRYVVNTVVDTLERAGIQLQHLTVLPQAMARLYREVNGSGEPAALALMLHGAPVIGVFQGGDVRFISEPPPSEDMLAAADIQTVIDQVGRARMYLRQHFRGADIVKIFVAADAGEQSHVDAVLNAALNLEVVPLAPTVGPPAAIAALGSVLNAESGAEMTLFPSPTDLVRKSAQRGEKLWTLGAGAICALALAVAVIFAVRASRAASELRAERAAADAQLAKIGSAMEVVDERRANMARNAALDAHYAERQHLARVLNGIRLAQPPGVGISGANLARSPEGWRVQISGTSSGASGADILEGVAEFSRELPQRIPLQSFNLDSFDYAKENAEAGTDAESGIFRLSFVATAGR